MVNNILTPKNDLSEIKEIVADLKQKNKKIILTSGCFDLLHYGHLELFYHAKEKGDVLIVLVSIDEDIRAIKGDKRPIQGEMDRAKLVNGFKPVDYVILHAGDIFFELLKTIHPYKIVKGSDYKKHKEHIAQITKYTKKGVDFLNRLDASTTDLINQCKNL